MDRIDSHPSSGNVSFQGSDRIREKAPSGTTCLQEAPAKEKTEKEAFTPGRGVSEADDNKRSLFPENLASFSSAWKDAVAPSMSPGSGLNEARGKKQSLIPGFTPVSSDGKDAVTSEQTPGNGETGNAAAQKNSAQSNAPQAGQNIQNAAQSAANQQKMNEMMQTMMQTQMAMMTQMMQMMQTMMQSMNTMNNGRNGSGQNNANTTPGPVNNGRNPLNTNGTNAYNTTGMNNINNGLNDINNRINALNNGRNPDANGNQPVNGNGGTPPSGNTGTVTPPPPAQNNPQPFPLKDGASITIPGTEGAIKNFRIGVIGNPDNIKKIYFVNHGDGNSDYFNSTKSDRQAMAKHLNPSEGAVVAYPISPAREQGTFAGGKNGESLLNAYRHLEKMTGNKDVAFEMFSLSGGGRANNALLNHINKNYDSDPNVKEFVDNHLKGIHDGDSLCRDIPQMKQNFKDAIRRFPGTKFSFIHNTSGYMSYVQGQQNEIASYVKNGYQDKTNGQGKVTPDKVYNSGGSADLENGRIRFWAAPTHWKAWAGQFEKVFFGN